MLAKPTATATPFSGVSPGPTPEAPRNLVLIVEDDDTVATLLTVILTRRGYQTLRARDGIECLGLFAAHDVSVRLAILDCRLPDTHGGSLCQALRKMAPGLPILLTSGRDHSKLPELFESTGPTAFMPKPFLPAQVEQHVNSLLGAIA